MFGLVDSLERTERKINRWTPPRRASSNQQTKGRPAPADWPEWLHRLFPGYVTAPFAERHNDFWGWVWDIEPGYRPRPLVAIWPRGGAKSTSAELAAVSLGGRLKRKYVLYVCATQDQADDHVSNIASMLESRGVGEHYPELADKLVGKYGNSKGWRRNRLRCANGFTVDALGLDSAARGAKLEENRPDLIILDDLDSDTDSEKVIKKKVKQLTKKILPAGSDDLAVLAVQNLVHANGIFAMLSDGRADFLTDRIISGPYPALVDLVTENRDGREIIVQGEPTWEGQGVEACQNSINDIGLAAFLQEMQHEVYGVDGQTFLPEWWDVESGRNRYRHDDSAIVNQVVARWLFADTSLKDKDTNDPNAILTAELLPDYRVLVRWLWAKRLQSAFLPETLTEKAILANRDGKLRGVVIEDKGSGTTAIQTLRKTSPEWLASLIVEFTPFGTKEYRAKTAAMWCPRDCVLLPYPAAALPWYQDFLDFQTGQLFRFPLAPHDDMVDVFVMMILYLEHYLSAGWHARNEVKAERQDKAAGKQHARVKQALARTGRT